MEIYNLYDVKECELILERINKLSIKSKALWGSMSVGQMCAHCNVPFEFEFTDMYPPIGWVKRQILTLFAKKMVVGSKPYPKNGRTAPEFIIDSEKDFEKEREKLIGYIKKFQSNGSHYYEGRPYRSFGKLSAEEWNNMYSKHLDHHLRQFGV